MSKELVFFNLKFNKGFPVSPEAEIQVKHDGAFRTIIKSTESQLEEYIEHLKSELDQILNQGKAAFKQEGSGDIVGNG